MLWVGILFCIVLMSNELLADGYIGNNRNWNLQRTPINGYSNSVSNPVHSIPKPLPEPIELGDTEVPTEITNPPTEITPPKDTSTGNLPQRLNLQRQPLREWKPLVEATTEPVAFVPGPFQTEPAYKTSSLNTLGENSLDDIEVFASESQPLPSRTTIIDESYLLQQKPAAVVDDSVIATKPEEIENSALLNDVSPVEPNTKLPQQSSVDSDQIEIVTEPFIPETPVVVLQSSVDSDPIEIVTESVIPETPAVISQSSVDSDRIEIVTEFVIPETPVVVPGDQQIIDESVIQDEEITLPEVTNKPVQVSTVNRRGLGRLLNARPVNFKPVQMSYSKLTMTKSVMPQRIISLPSLKPNPPASLNQQIETKIPSKVLISKSTQNTKPSFNGKTLNTITKDIDSELMPLQLQDFNCEQHDAFYSLPNECDTYVECKAFTAFKYTCPDGLHFNPKAVWPEYPCAYPSEVKCDSNTVKQQPQPTEECPRQYGFYALPEDCSKYVMCQKGFASLMNCPPGLVFNNQENACDWPENVPSCKSDVFRGFTCPEKPLLDDDGSFTDIIFKYRYGKSCKEYVACHRGYPRLLRCDAGLSFDEISEVCVDSDYVQNCS